MHGNKGKKQSIGHKRKRSESLKGRKLSLEHIKKLSISHLGKKGYWSGKTKPRGEKSFNWKGGLTPIHTRIRNSLEYKMWRMSVFQRDRFTCIWCGYRSKGSKIVDIHADHIKRFSMYPELRLAIDNGRTLCVPCHKTTYKLKE